MNGYVYVVRRNDPLDTEVDVVEDHPLAVLLAAAVDGWVDEQPILRSDDEYVALLLAADGG